MTDTPSPGPRSPHALVLAGLLLVAGLPLAGIASPLAAAEGCEKVEEKDYLMQSTPLEEEFSASQMLYMMTTEMDLPIQRERANGVDAYVIDLDCRVPEEAFTYRLDGNAKGNTFDLSIKFYDPFFQPTSEVIDPADDTGSEGYVPEGSSYAVVLLEEGPYLTGFTRSSDAGPVRPYSVAFEFSMDRG